MKTNSGFRKDFSWGAATAAYQIEGAVREGGRGPSTWDMFCKKPGAIWRDNSGDVASDHYHRWREDITLMKRLGLDAYRLSIAWSRVMPSGTGHINPKGLGFYDRLVDGLLKAGIKPWVTLFHWDYPLALYKRGGWLHPDSPKWFADYTRVVVDRLSDRVSDWMTLNEPPCFVFIGHLYGTHAPGDKLPLARALRVQHNTFLSHGRGVQVIRERAKLPPRVGIACVSHSKTPVSLGKADIETARQSTFTTDTPASWSDAWWMDPVILGRYPEDGIRANGKAMPKVTRDEMALMSQPLDFLGINVYQGGRVRRGANGKAVEVPYPVGNPITAFKWNLAPDSLYWAARFYYERYRLPIAVTENGMSGTDWASLDGKVHDPQRIDFLDRYLSALRQAARDGADIIGYFHWSLLDNFEWAEGFKERFGLIHVDYPTGKRTPKDSYYHYRKIISGNGKNLPKYRPMYR